MSLRMCALASLAVCSNAAGTGGARERVKFDFAWRHALIGPSGPPPPAPPPVGPTHCPSPDHFPANKSGVMCGGLLKDPDAATTADACAMNCCNDQRCSVWQFSNVTDGGGCWLGVCASGFSTNKAWVGGERPPRVKPLAPPPPPPPTPSDHPAQATPTFDDSAWSIVDLPHDMNMGNAGTPGGATASFDLCPGGCSGRSYIQRHTGWYRKHFNLPADWKDSHVSVVFEGAFHFSMVYVNGRLIGNHSCGYTSFDVELSTAPLNFGGTNTIAVYTDATSGSGWWYEGGGLFRHVWLMKRSPVHLTTWGTFVAPLVHVDERTPPEDLGSGHLQATASLNISAVVASTLGAPAGSVSAVFDLLDATSKVTTTLKAKAVSVTPGAESILYASGEVTSAVDLWTIRAPTLYTVRTRLLSTSGALLDDDNTTVGFRSLRYEADTGFHMSEQHVKVRGFCDHNDFANVGVGVPDRINLFRAQAARSIGGNGRRTSHNPPDPSMLSIYDRVGIVVMDENRDFEVGQRFYDNMADLVQRDRNHPSVTIWSFCNEGGCTGSGAAGPGFRHASYEYDGTRPVLGNMIGSCSTDANGNVTCTGQFGNELTDSTDVQGFSHSGFGTIESFHKKYPTKPLYESECCSCNTQRGENVCQGSGCETTAASVRLAVGDGDHPQHDTNGVEASFNADCLASQTNTSNGVPWMSGSMVWTLFDYYGEPSFGGWPHVSSTFGSFDLTGFAKAGAWWYKSWWLLSVDDMSADKPFATAGEHTVRIVESWEKPTLVPLDNSTDVTTCDAAMPGQKFKFTETSGEITDLHGLCVDGACQNFSIGCQPLALKECDGSKSQQWSRGEHHQFINAVVQGTNKGCIDLWGSGAGPGVGIYSCELGGGDLGQQWLTFGDGFKTAATHKGSKEERCLTNGDGGLPGGTMTVHVYTDLPVVELLVNGVSKGEQSMLNPQFTPTATAKSWAQWDKIHFEEGNLTAVAKDSTSGAPLATHTVLTSGPAAAIALSLDAPSVKTGTGSALLLDGQDAGLVRATIVDAKGNLVADAQHNVSFEIVTGPGRIIGAHNGNPQCHEPNQVAWHSAYHGLVRAIVMTTEDKSSPPWHRERLQEIDIEAGTQTRIITKTGDDAIDNVAAPIVLQATAPGLSTATITIPTSTDLADGVMHVAAASAGKPVTIE